VLANVRSLVGSPPAAAIIPSGLLRPRCACAFARFVRLATASAAAVPGSTALVTAIMVRRERRTFAPRLAAHGKRDLWRRKANPVASPPDIMVESCAGGTKRFRELPPQRCDFNLKRILRHNTPPPRR